MPIILRLDRVMADRKMSLNRLAQKVGISNVNLSNIKTGKISAIRFSTLEAICRVLDCQPGDILEYRPEEYNKGLLRNACTPCHSEPVVTPAWESVPNCIVKRIATPVCGLVRNDRTAFCNRPLWSC